MNARRFLRLLIYLCCGVLSIACAEPDSDTRSVEPKNATHASVGTAREATVTFSAQRAFAILEKQCEFGPRPPGSAAHRETRDYLFTELQKYTNSVTLQPIKYKVGHSDAAPEQYFGGVRTGGPHPLPGRRRVERRFYSLRIGIHAPSLTTTRNLKIGIHRSSVPTTVPPVSPCYSNLPESLKRIHHRGGSLSSFLMAKITAELPMICLSVPGSSHKTSENGDRTTGFC